MYNKLLNNHQIIVKLITFAQNNEYQKFIELLLQRKEVAKKKEEVEKQKQETEKLKKKEKEVKELYLKELLLFVTEEILSITAGSDRGSYAKRAT